MLYLITFAVLSFSLLVFIASYLSLHIINHVKSNTIKTKLEISKSQLLQFANSTKNPNL